MPGCFSFQRKNDPDQKNVPFNLIDDEMRVHFGAEPDPIRYYYGWYDHIGLALAMGQSLEQIRDRFKELDEPMGISITEWLMEHFNTNAYYAPRSITG